MPKVSIIVPVYNAEKAIERCIKSILEQHYKDLELILVDDGSKDDSGRILDEYAEKDSRVKVIHKPNSGVSDTRNKALDLASGEYIQFLDADDWIPEVSTAELVRAMEESDADLVVGDFYRVVGEKVAIKGSIITDRLLTRKEYAEFMMDSPADYYYGVIWNKLYRKEIIDAHNLRMDKELSFCEDYIFNLEYILYCDKIRPLQVPVYYYVKTEGSLVSQNISISKIIKMKTNVYTYYDNFYKSILDPEQYYEDRAAIAKFLISAARDDMVIPMMPNTKKLGEEKVQAYYEPLKANGLNALSYYISKAFDRRMETVAQKFDLDLKDVKVIVAIKEAGAISNTKAITDYYNMSWPSVMVTLEKLAFKGLVKIRYELDNISAHLTEEADELNREISIAIDEIYQLCMTGFSEKEEYEAMKALNHMADNLRGYIKK